MKSSLLSVLFYIIIFSVSGQAIKKTDIHTGHQYAFQSDVLNTSVDLYVGLPENYAQSTCTYPVHYVLDGQIIFSFYNGVMDILGRGEVPEAIVVGIRSINRGHFFMPGKGTGEFAAFLSEELFPFIETNYRTRNFRLIIGHSTTGAFVFNMLLDNPDLFDIYLAGAPYHAGFFLENNRVSDLHDYESPKYFYSFYGLDDNKTEKSNWDSLVCIVQEREFHNLKLIQRDYDNEDHYTVLFRYVPDGLKEAFKNWSYRPSEGTAFSMAGFENYKTDQRSRFNTCFEYTEAYYIGHSINLSRQGNTETAISLLSYGLEKYPESQVLNNIIAREYEKTGKTDLAVFHYRKVLDLDPDSEEIRKKLSEIEKK